MSLDLFETALRYREAGRSIIPTGKDKRPTIKQWKPFQNAIPDESYLKAWFPKHKYIAIITGRVSNNLELIDFDFDPERPNTFNEWRNLLEEEAPGLFDRLTIQTTQNNGFHSAYCCPELEIPGNQKLAQWKNGTEVKALIETRGEGGYFLVYPSPGYKLWQGSFTELPVLSKQERDTLINCARMLNEYIEPQHITNGPRQNKSTGLSPGDDFNQRGLLPQLLEKHGWVRVRGGSEHYERWRRPGKDKGSSASIIDGRIFYNFSSNAHPFEPFTSYSPFAVYALLEHSGDYSLAGKELAKYNYGDPPAPRTTTDTSDHPEPKNLEFPETTMAGVAGDFANLYSSYLEVPVHFFYMAFLGCLGAALADRLTLASQIRPQPRLYLIFLGESADDKKSTAIKITADFYEDTLTEFAVCWGVGSAEGLQKVLKKENKLLLCFDEFKSFVGKCQTQGSILLPCVNTLFESNRYENHTKNSEVCIKNVYLTLLAASTVQTYENTWSSQFTDIGFNNRLFLVPGSGKRKHSIPGIVPDRDNYLLRKQLAQVFAHVGDGLELNITPEARELYHQWYMNRENSVHTRRLDTYALRLMSLLTVNELKTEVDTEIVRKVMALCDWQLNVRILYDPIDADNAIAKLEEKIRRVLTARGGLKDWELRQYCNVKSKGLWSYGAAKKNLMAANELKLKNKVFSLTTRPTS